MNFLGLNFSFSMERLWLGSEESLVHYLEMMERLDASISARAFASGDDDEGAVNPADIGDYITTRQGNTAVVAIKGSLVNGYQSWHPIVTGLITSYEAIRATAAKLAADPEIKNVVLDIGSPGGTAVGVQSAGKAIQKLGRKKNVVAHTDSMAASAAYWLAAAASSVSASEMAEVGSIGVITLFPDLSKALDNAGISVHMVKAGKYKGAGVPYKPFTEEELAYLQARVDKTNNFFLSHVSRRRNLKLSERENWADAKVFYAGEAKAVGLIDEVADLSDILGGLSANGTTRGKNMQISEEKLAMIAAGGAPESVLTPEELAAYNEQATAEAAEEVVVEATGIVEATEEPTPAAAANADLAKDLGRAEARLEAANAQIEALKTDLAASQEHVESLKAVAQAAVANLQVALNQPRETKDSPAAIAEQYAGLKQLMTSRFKVGRQTDASASTRELDVRPRASRVPNPVRPQ